jgi:hypothetical protein
MSAGAGDLVVVLAMLFLVATLRHELLRVRLTMTVTVFGTGSSDFETRQESVPHDLPVARHLSAGKHFLAGFTADNKELRGHPRLQMIDVAKLDANMINHIGSATHHVAALDQRNSKRSDNIALISWTASCYLGRFLLQDKVGALLCRASARRRSVPPRARLEPGSSGVASFS